MAQRLVVRTGNELTTVSENLVVLSMTAGEQLATRLQQLISQSAIEQVSIYRFSDHKLHPQSKQWSFGYEFITMGISPTTWVDW